MRRPGSRRYWWALGLTLLTAFVARMLVAFTMPNMVWPDEIFQTMEPAHRVVFGPGMVPWEFRDGLRSWMLPGLLAGVMEVTSWLTSSVTAYLMACAAVMSVISLAPAWAAFRASFEAFGLRAAVVTGAFVALWFELLFFAPKALSEVVAGNLLALGTVLASACVAAATRDDGTLTRRLVIVFTACLALTAMLRIHLSIAALTMFVVVFLRLPRHLRWTSLAVGAAVVLACGMLDALTWDYPFQSYVENVIVNVVKGKSSHYGTASEAAYFAVYARIWGLWGIPIVALAVLGARHAPLMALCALLVIASHIPIAHKEYRFAYPAMVLVVMLAGLGAAWVVRWIQDHRTPRLATLVAAALVALCVTASAVGSRGFHASKTQLALVWGDEQDHWVRRRGGLLAMRQLGEDPSVCGVALAGVGWGDTGGYTYLHRDIPVFPFRNQQVLWSRVANFNAMLMKPGKAHTIGPFVQDTCWEDLCIYVRPGECEKWPGYDVNEVLKMLGQ